MGRDVALAAADSRSANGRHGSSVFGAKILGMYRYSYIPSTFHPLYLILVRFDFDQNIDLSLIWDVGLIFRFDNFMQWISRCNFQSMSLASAQV